MEKKTKILVFFIIIFEIAGWSYGLSLKQSDAFLNEGLNIKALALGGSYIGIEDDVSTIVYNPASLGLLKNKQFFGAYSQNTITKMKMSKIFLGYADLIDYNINYGIALLGERIENIEGNNSTYESTGELIANNETIDVISAGINIISRLTVGISLKILSRHLAGYSSTGAGIDIGLYWMRKEMVKHSMIENIIYNFEAGLAIKNILGPTLKLKGEGEREPIEIRGGLGYTFEVLNLILQRSSALITAEGVYREDTKNIECLAGVELKIMELIRLRVGYGLKIIRGGLGIALDKFEFNYGYINNKYLGDTHNIGITIRFNNLSGERADRLYGKGMQRYYKGEYEEALEYMEKAIEISPNDIRIQKEIDNIKRKIKSKKRSKKVKKSSHKKSIQELIKELPEEERERVEFLYYEGLDKYYRDDKKRAIEMWKKIKTKNRELQKLIEKLISKVEQEE